MIKRGYTLIELMTALGIMAIIALIIAMNLKTFFEYTERVTKVIDNGYSFSEATRYINVSMKKNDVTRVVVGEDSINLYSDLRNNSEFRKVEIRVDGGSLKFIYYTRQISIFKKETTRTILKNVEKVRFSLKNNLIYFTVYWKNGGEELSVLNL